MTRLACGLVQKMSSTSCRPSMALGRLLLHVLVVILSWMLLACTDAGTQPPSSTAVSPAATAAQAAGPAAPAPTTVTDPAPVAELAGNPSPMPTGRPATPATIASTLTQTPAPSASLLPGPSSTTAACSLGIGLRRETEPIVLRHGRPLGLIMAASAGLAEACFTEVKSGIRVLGAPSLEDLRRKAERAALAGVPYEALGYGLETGRSTPEEEWRDVVASTQTARAIADEFGKLLLMGPGFRLMSQNWEEYPAMAALADIWVLQTQRLQTLPPGSQYRQEVERVVDQIRAGNPDILVWAQITLPPDREPDSGEWIAYHESIADLVAGRTYVGAYTWDRTDPEQLAATMEAIVASVCGNEP